MLFYCSLPRGGGSVSSKPVLEIQPFCQLRDDSTLVIRPHPSFLAKNESPEERWQHTTIPLLLQGGSPSHLCPVKALQNYIRLTSSVKSGNLFLHHKTGKPLSIKQLSTAVCKLILQADPLVTVPSLYSPDQFLWWCLQPKIIILHPIQSVALILNSGTEGLSRDCLPLGKRWCLYWRPRSRCVFARSHPHAHDLQLKTQFTMVLYDLIYME